MQLRSIVAGVSGAAVLATALSITSTAGADQATAPAAEPPVTLRGVDKVVAYTYGKRVYSDLGLRLVAGDTPFEIHAKRPTWDDQIQAVWKAEGGDIALPEGTMATFQGLSGFVDVTITRVADGTVVRDISVDACFNGYEPARTRPDAPARSPYPTGCPWNPYTIGSVMGIQAGWSTPLFPEYDSPFRLGTGRYDVVARVTEKYADLFGIPAEPVETRLVVRHESEEGHHPRTGHQHAPALEPAADRAPRQESVGAMAPAYAPDLKSLPAFGIQLNGKGTSMRFGATVWNGGTGPLVVDGFRDGNADHMDAYQYFYDADGEETGYESVGEFHFHGANHQHWHFEDFARYRLLNEDLTKAVRSTKESFCLVATDAVDYTIPNADWQPSNTDLSSACGGPEAQGLRQVLANGSGDTYHQYRAGQAFRIGDLPDGIYWLSVEANPFGALVETDETNNASLRKVRIGTRESGRRFVRSFQVGIIEESMPDWQ